MDCGLRVNLSYKHFRVTAVNPSMLLHDGKLLDLVQSAQCADSQESMCPQLESAGDSVRLVWEDYLKSPRQPWQVETLHDARVKISHRVSLRFGQ